MIFAWFSTSFGEQDTNLQNRAKTRAFQVWAEIRFNFMVCIQTFKMDVPAT